MQQPTPRTLDEIESELSSVARHINNPYLTILIRICQKMKKRDQWNTAEIVQVINEAAAEEIKSLKEKEADANRANARVQERY